MNKLCANCFHSTTDKYHEIDCTSTESGRKGDILDDDDTCSSWKSIDKLEEKLKSILDRESKRISGGEKNDN